MDKNILNIIYEKVGEIFLNQNEYVQVGFVLLAVATIYYISCRFAESEVFILFMIGIIVKWLYILGTICMFEFSKLSGIIYAFILFILVRLAKKHSLWASYKRDVYYENYLDKKIEKSDKRKDLFRFIV